MTRTGYGILTLAIAVALGFGAPAFAQEDAQDYLSNLTCFKVKVKGDQKVKGTASIAAPLSGIQALGFADSCKIKKATHVCLPSNESNAQVSIKKDAVSAQDMWSGYGPAQICYKVRCKKKPGDIELQDQFASYTFSKLRADTLCGPALNKCTDSSRTVFAGGPGTGQSGGSCRQFTDQASCEVAWAAHGGRSLTPMACEWNGSGCFGMEDVSGDNTCVSCADITRSEDWCGDYDDTSQAECEDYWYEGGFGPTSCTYNSSSGRCRPCGLTNELGLPDADSDFEGCTNVCRHSAILP